MSIVKNEPKIKNKLVQKIRAQLEHRAMWLALLDEQAEKKGLSLEDYAFEGINKCGCIQGKELSDGSKSFKTLKKNLFNLPARMVFEMKILECSDDKLSIDFHYCPLVKAWQKLGISDEKIAVLCDAAMCGDRGIASAFGGELNLGEVIAKGADKCQIRFCKKQ